MNIRLGRISHLISPGYSWCLRCHTTWVFVKKHHTYYTDWVACFPLCEKCWAQLRPEQRMPYYEELCREWEQQSGPMEPSTADQIRAAVLAGK